jgi:hypothetical protein
VVNINDTNLSEKLAAVGAVSDPFIATRAVWPSWLAWLAEAELTPDDWAPDLVSAEGAESMVVAGGLAFAIVGDGEIVVVGTDDEGAAPIGCAVAAGFRAGVLVSDDDGVRVQFSRIEGSVPRPAGRVADGEQTEATVLAGTVAANAVLVSVAIHSFGIRRRAGKALSVTEDQSGQAVDESVLSIGKKLLDSETWDAIASLDGGFRREVERHALASRFRRGTWLLPLRLLDWFEAELESYQGERAVLVDQLCAEYTTLIESARGKLGPLFDERQYPSVDVVRDCYRVDVRYESPGVPAALESVAPEIFAREASKLRASMESAAMEARLALRRGLLDVVANIQGKLSAEEGKKKRLSTAAVENLNSWLELFNDRDITNDADLAALVEKCRGLMAGVDRDLLKDDAAVAKQVRDGFVEVTAKLGNMVEEAPERFFDLED